MDDIDKLRNHLKIDPNNIQLRSSLLHELFFSANGNNEEAKQNVIWFIKNKPDYDAEWLQWRSFFCDPIEFPQLLELWKDQVRNYNFSPQILKNAARFTSGLNEDFSTQCWKDLFNLNPADLFVKEELAFSLFYKERKSVEGFNLFNELFNSGDLVSIFSLGTAILCAFEVNQYEVCKKWIEKLDNEVHGNESRIMSEELYPAYSALIIKSIWDKETDKISFYLSKIEKLNCFYFPNFFNYDERTIKLLKNFGYDKEAKNYAAKIVQITGDKEIEERLLSIIDIY